jgi:hypothetical protein
MMQIRMRYHARDTVLTITESAIIRGKAMSCSSQSGMLHNNDYENRFVLERELAAC